MAAFADWWAIGTSNRRAELVLKPLAMAFLVVVALFAGDVSTGLRVLVVLGALCGLIGDTALLDHSTPAFLIGLTAFLVGHALYAIAAVTFGFGWWALAGAILILALFSWRFLPVVVPRSRLQGGTFMMCAVLTYASVIAIMVITAFGTGHWAVAAGAMLFAFSDWVLGQRRFVGPETFHNLAVMVPYHVGQALLILGLLTVI